MSNISGINEKSKILAQMQRTILIKSLDLKNCIESTKWENKNIPKKFLQLIIN